MDWEHHLQKQIQSKKLKKNSKDKLKLPHVNKKPPAKKLFFVQTPFSHSSSNIKQKILLAFSLHFLFRRDQNHYSNLTSKIRKTSAQFLKKDSA